MPDQVTVIGGTGALGSGLALRLAVAGVPVVIGSRDATARARRPRACAKRAGSADVRGLENGARGRGERGRVPVRPVPQPVRDAHEPQEPPARGPARWSTRPCRSPPPSRGRATRMLGVWQGSAAQQAPRWCPTACASSPRCTRSARPRSGDLDARRSTRTCSCAATGARTRRAPPRSSSSIAGPALRRRRAARDGAHRRVADRAADRRSTPATRRTPASSITGLDRPARGRPARRRHRRREARPRACSTSPATSSS